MHVADVGLAAGEHRDAIDAQRHAAVRRRAVAQRFEEEAEAVVDLSRRSKPKRWKTLR